MSDKEVLVSAICKDAYRASIDQAKVTGPRYGSEAECKMNSDSDRCEYTGHGGAHWYPYPHYYSYGGGSTSYAQPFYRSFNGKTFSSSSTGSRSSGVRTVTRSGFGSSVHSSFSSHSFGG